MAAAAARSTDKKHDSPDATYGRAAIAGFARLALLGECAAALRQQAKFHGLDENSQSLVVAWAMRQTTDCDDTPAALNLLTAVYMLVQGMGHNDAFGDTQLARILAHDAPPPHEDIKIGIVNELVTRRNRCGINRVGLSHDIDLALMRHVAARKGQMTPSQYLAQENLKLSKLTDYIRAAYPLAAPAD